MLCYKGGILWNTASRNTSRFYPLRDIKTGLKLDDRDKIICVWRQNVKEHVAEMRADHALKHVVPAAIVVA